MEEIPSFIRRKEITDFADGLDELVEGSGTNASEVGLELGEGHPDGVDEVGTAGGQEQKPTALSLRAALSLLCVARLSGMTPDPKANA